MYQITLVCKGVPAKLGVQAALDITEEFIHRPWHPNVLCEWEDGELILHAENDWDADAKAIFDEYADAIAACIPGLFEGELEIRSIKTI